MAAVMKVRLTFLEEVLGTQNNNPDVHREFIASKGPDAAAVEEEMAALPTDVAVAKCTTVFPRDTDGCPFVYDYQLRGFFKDACGMLRRVPGTQSSKLQAYLKVIDGLVFVQPRRLRFQSPTGPVLIDRCVRPLRADTPKGERVSLASSETVPAGTFLDAEIRALNPDTLALVREWLDYGTLRGLGQWRNSGKGVFKWEVIQEVSAV